MPITVPGAKNTRVNKTLSASSIGILLRKIYFIYIFGIPVTLIQNVFYHIVVSY